jgi:hypothetical protein
MQGRKLRKPSSGAMPVLGNMLAAVRGRAVPVTAATATAKPRNAAAVLAKLFRGVQAQAAATATPPTDTPPTDTPPTDTPPTDTPPSSKAAAKTQTGKK